jgi:ketosteroid isomerase-like protein
MAHANPGFPLSKTDIDTAVRTYWKIFTSKKEVDNQKNWYTDNAIIFATTSKRPEPARLVSVRRQREYLDHATKMKVEIANIEVELLGANDGYAAYVMQFHAEQIATFKASGQTVTEEHMEHARVTQIFHREADGAIKIVHEHISAPE